MNGGATNDDWISSSKVAFDKLFPLIEQAIKNGEKVVLTIE